MAWSPPSLTRAGATLQAPYATRPADVVRMREAGLIPQSGAAGHYVPASVFLPPKVRP